MKEITPGEIGHQDLHKILLGGIAPRPIAFASTIDREGNPNLSPFSFYNAFGVNPSTLIFSPSRRGRDNTIKHTLENIREVPEVVINTVTYDMVHQMSLSSTEYPKGVNEFVKAGLTQVESRKVKPFRVKESPLQFECRVREVIETSGKPGSGNLVICEIVLIHIDENILDKNGIIDPDKIDLVGRMGGNYYVRASGSAVFEIPKPLTTLGIGVDSLPESARLSKVLTGNDLGQLGNLEKMPSPKEIEEMKNTHEFRELHGDLERLHRHVKSLINSGKAWIALKLLMAADD
ncbi:MAG: flavin reductase family protein [Chlorobi bacterium]|nr:flavin reductase family protein [Chlorobiota bacterium]